MAKQLFLVSLEVPADVSGFPVVGAEHMASIIRDAIEAKSCSFGGPVPFEIAVGRLSETASARGEMPEYSPERFDGLDSPAVTSVETRDTRRD